jgi:hypothetical protein
MSQSNGTGRLPAIQAAAPGAFKRAVERHRSDSPALHLAQRDRGTRSTAVSRSPEPDPADPGRAPRRFSRS